MKNIDQRGFSALIAVLVLVAMGVIGFGGWYVWKKNSKESNRPVEQAVQTQAEPKAEEQKPVDLYEGWKTHTNSTYGITFRYPGDWRVEEVAGSAGSSKALLTVEHAINLKRSQEVKYNNTTSIEIFSGTLDRVGKVQDDFYAQSASNNVIKVPERLKDRQGISYKITNGTTVTKQYLIAVGSKVYLFRSINEDLNIQTDSAYWDKFDRIFGSLNIN